MELTKLIMSCVVSIVVLSTALYIILSDKYDEASKKWAIGAISGITGYWLGNAF